MTYYNGEPDRVPTRLALADVAAIVVDGLVGASGHRGGEIEGDRLMLEDTAAQVADQRMLQRVIAVLPQMDLGRADIADPAPYFAMLPIDEGIKPGRPGLIEVLPWCGLTEPQRRGG